MPNWSRTTECRYSGFTLVELLDALLVGMILLAGFTTFYLSEQRALAHHKVEIELSQELRTALEQISRDLRSARKDLTRDPADPVTFPGANARFLTAAPSEVVFELDADDNGSVDADDDDEHKGFRLAAGRTTVEQFDASGDADCEDDWCELAGFAGGAGNRPQVEELAFAYWTCGAVAAVSQVTSPTELDRIMQIDVTMTMRHTAVGGLPVRRTETETVRLRNVRCS